MKRSKEYWQRLNVDITTSRLSRATLKEILTDGKLDIAELHKTIEDLQKIIEEMKSGIK